MVLVLASGTATNTSTGSKVLDVVIYVDGSPTAWKQQVSLASGGSGSRQLLAAVNLPSGSRQLTVKTDLASGSGTVNVGPVAMTVTTLP